ncbi:WD40-repeat-containing domain protein [Bisporella sp. PMI_857]|nr:WD40-repeat-containing domain protein [Bisporella sp. PMI_857]
MEVALPKIQVTDDQNKEGSVATIDSPTVTDSGQSVRPRSATSSEVANKWEKGTCQAIRSATLKDANGERATSPPLQSSTAIDPLSHHILKRTNTESIIPQKLRNAGLPDSPKLENVSTPEVAGPPSRQQTPEIGRTDSIHLKEKKKGVSFLSRFSIIGGKKKDQTFDADDDESELGDPRTEGMNACVFSSSIGANGYIPQHKEPPRYIKVRAHNKKDREFNRMFLAQELSGSKHHSVSDEKVPGITTTDVPHKLSKTGKAGGAVWAMEFSKDGKYLAAAGRDQVVRVWAVISTPGERREHEHEEDVVSGSSGGERLSAPVFRSKPIREFEGHTGDILDLSWSKNNFLLSSSMDKTVRLWHISRQECLCTFKHKDFVTSIAFHPKDDRFFLAGSLDSVLRLWSIPDKSVAFWNQLPDLITAVAFTQTGRLPWQIHVRSSRGKNAKGSKITGIRTITFPPDDPEGEMKVLITSNDSRVRVYNLRDKSLEMKFRGHENTCSQINASFSDDAQYIICGSEDRKAYIWSTTQVDPENKDKRPLEFFEAHPDIVTAAIIAPTKSRQLLSASGDPIYDLSTHLRQRSNIRETPAYLARCTHMDGNIIITADYQGGIKVFRQDCAFHKRRQESWETGSMFSKKMLGRSNSIMTRNSAGSHSRRNSVSRNSTGAPTLQSDHILSWRNSVNTKNSRTDRSVSPGKFNRGGQSPSSGGSHSNLASTARQPQYTATPLHNASSVSTTSPPQSLYKAPSYNISQPPTPGFSMKGDSDDNPFSSVAPKLEKKGSYVSELSSDDPGTEEDSSEGEALACRKCGGKDFRARKVGKGQKLVCKKCGTTAD